ncbi:MAG: sigma-70 family RNA polymerase sigma factor [Chloroflexi bacterium]|nr:sigma-70 family RNA polymerase sigma factor [Chloroflexota bacterium]
MPTKSAVVMDAAAARVGEVPKSQTGPTHPLSAVMEPGYGLGSASMGPDRQCDASVRSETESPMAFETAFERHWAEVSSVVARLVGDMDVARDIAQDTFVQLLRRPPSPDIALRPWLVRVAINRAYNELRGNRRRYEREVRDFRERQATDEPSSETASANLIAERDLVRQTLLELPERSRELLGLRAEGFSYIDIASVMQISPGSVGTLLARAERAFRVAYEARRGGM